MIKMMIVGVLAIGLVACTNASQPTTTYIPSNAFADLLTETDEEILAQTIKSALESSYSSQQPVHWYNPDTTHGGFITADAVYWVGFRRWCREFIQVITVRGKTDELGTRILTERSEGSACRQSDYTWKIVTRFEFRLLDPID